MSVGEDLFKEGVGEGGIEVGEDIFRTVGGGGGQ